MDNIGLEEQVARAHREHIDGAILAATDALVVAGREGTDEAFAALDEAVENMNHAAADFADGKVE